MNESQTIQFSLAVDDFGVNFVSNENAQYLLDCLTEHNEVSAYWTREQFIGLTLG